MHVSKMFLFYYHLFSQCRPKRIWEIRPLREKYPNSLFYLFMLIFSFSLSINSPTHPNFVEGVGVTPPPPPPPPPPCLSGPHKPQKVSFPSLSPLPFFFFFFFFFLLPLFFFSGRGGGARPVRPPPWIRQCVGSGVLPFQNVLCTKQ